MPLIRGMRHLALYQLVLSLGVTFLLLFPGTGEAAQSQTLGLSDILARAANYDPSTKAGAARVRAAEAGLTQAGTRPNPVLGIETEDFAGSGNYSRFDEIQTTLYYEELWERGGKRKARTDVAGAELTLAQRRKTTGSLDLAAEVQTAWVEALAAQEAAALAEEQFATAKRMEREFRHRADRALDPQFAYERIRATTAQAEIAHERAVLNAQAARESLASYWGGTGDFQLDRAPFVELSTDGEVKENSTDIELLRAAREAAAARVRLEKAHGVQDVSLRAGLRHFSADDDVAMIFGVSIPLGVYDTNRGNIERAQAEQLAAEIDIAATRARREREIARLAASRATTAKEVRRIDTEVLPGLERAVALVREGFGRGGTAFTLLEVTEAQRALADASSRRIELLRQFHLDSARLDRLTDRHASIFSHTETNQ